MKIAFLDPFGSEYDDITLLKRGLGGAEASLIYLARELSALGHQVDVYNHCPDQEKQFASGVEYFDINTIPLDYEYDVIIGSRSMVCFDPDYKSLSRNFDFPPFYQMKAKHRVLWRHDTYVEGDERAEEALKNKYLNEVFFLSNFHKHHWLENISWLPEEDYFVTSNGVQNFDPPFARNKEHTFVWNAAAYKGLDFLLERVWPKIHGDPTRFGKPKLKVIGGYYQYNSKDFDYENFNTLSNWVEISDVENWNIEFTGILTPKEVANEVSQCRAMLYPIQFPETFGISALECQLYGVPVITKPIGAFAETLDPDCHYLVQNGTVEEYLDAIELSIKEPILWVQKVANCRDALVPSWRNVAEEWVEHFEEKLNMKDITGVEPEPQPEPKKKIMIAIPTARYIEPETFKSIYDLEIPEGYECDFHFVWCYLIDQGRNHIAADMLREGYDYTLCVDADIILPKDALVKMLSHEKDIVMGMYRMRRPEEVIEVYDFEFGQMPASVMKTADHLMEVGGGGFGCTLVSRKVYEAIGYPWFEYHQAWEYHNTFSEDNDFYKKAKDKGFKVYCDPTIYCGHKGTVVWEIGSQPA